MFRFSETEALVFLTVLLKNFKITLADEVKVAGETLEETQKRLCESEVAISIRLVVSLPS